MIYFDATFLVRLYVNEPGHDTIRALAARQLVVASSVWGKMEAVAAFHRKLREGILDKRLFSEVNRQLEQDADHEALVWYQLTAAIVEEVRKAYLTLPTNVYLRTGDAVHLATAAEAGFKEIYSNDRHLLAAAPIFKLKGINPLSKT